MGGGWVGCGMGVGVGVGLGVGVAVGVGVGVEVGVGAGVLIGFAATVGAGAEFAGAPQATIPINMMIQTIITDIRGRLRRRVPHRAVIVLRIVVLPIRENMH